MAGRAERDRVVVPLRNRLAGRELHLVAQHAQVDVDRGRLASLVIDLDRHDIGGRRHQDPRGDALPLRGHQRVVEGEMLAERPRDEDVLAGVDESHVDEPASVAVVAVRAAEAERRAVHRVNVDAVDLQLDRRRRRPDEAAHPAVADRHALFGAGHGRVIVEIRSQDLSASIDLDQASRRDGFQGGRQQRDGQNGEWRPETAHGVLLRISK